MVCPCNHGLTCCEENCMFWDHAESVCLVRLALLSLNRLAMSTADNSQYINTLAAAIERRG
jgi:hypothetical protein